jgi:hypothetical protein
MRWWPKYRELIEFLGLVIAWPALTYVLISCLVADEGYYRNRPESAVTLAIIGLLAWVAIKVRRGG